MTSGSQPTVTYRVTPPGGTWEQADNGIYEILLNDGAVTDTRSGTPNATQAQRLGEFAVDIAFVGQIPVDVFADGADSDTGDGISNNGSGQSTLRSAIQTANNDPGLNTLVLEAGTYVLDVGTSGEDLAAEGDLDVTDDLLIKGNGATIQITGSIDRVFDVLTGASLTLEDVMVTGGSVSGAGGGIRNAGTLVISASTLHDNTATTGGAIASTAGTVTATNSTISTNAATDAAGIDISGGTATLLHVTVTANDASTATGGVRQSAGGSVTLTSTIIAANTAPADPDSTGTFTSTFSLIGDAGSATGLSDGIDSNQVGSSGSEIDPLLGPLADNTGSTMTHRPLVGSSAIDAADNESAPATDQRGIDRAVNGNPSEDPLAQADIGAVERFFADISGITFRDTNGNGIQDNGEPGEPGFTVYLDLNNNEVLDPREPQTVSRMDDPATMSINEAGAYEFTLVSPGEYTLRELVPAEWSLTAPERNPEEALSVLPELKAAQGGDGTRGIVYTTKLATDDNELPVFPIGDFNGDALADFAVVNERTESVERSRYDISLVFGLGSASAELDLATLEPGNSPRGLFITQSQSPVTISNVAGADLNDDGFSDLVIGAKNDENNDQSPGRVFVVFGTDTHPLAPVDLGTLEAGDGSTGFVIHGDPATDFILGANRQNGGFAVGDVNNDGIDDLAFASEFASPAGRSEAGRIRILFGSDGSFPAVINLASPAGVTLADIQGEVPGDRLGRNVEIGDVTGDGIDDIVAGAELFRDGVRHRNVFIVAGRNVWPTVLNASQITTESPAGFELESEDGSVHNIALSDFDGDGLVDVFLAANQDTVVYGSFLQSQLPQRTLDLNTLPGFNVSGIRTPEAGDFNADGFGDLIVFQSSGNRLNLQRTGLSHILFGSTDAFTQQNTTMGSAAYNTALDGFRNLVFAGDFNEQVRNPVLVGDTNGDGYEDFVTSTFQLTVDLVYLVYGKPIVTALPRSSHWALRLTPARAEHNLDFANQPLPSTLRGTVFRDGDQDGSRDVGEFGIEGFEVYLDANTNGMLDVGERSVLTDGVGGYVFADVAPFETHVVRQVNRAGFTQTAPDAGSGFEHSVTPQPGQVVDGLDFGNADNVGGVGLGGAVLEGRVFDDLNGNGVQDGGEPGLGGVTVYLDLNEDGDLDDTPILEPRIVTGASGDYAFIDLDNRNYIVRTVLPADLVQTSPLKSEFASQASASGQGPVAAVPIFFDGDAYPDLAVLTASRQDILIRVNNGDGMFAPGFSICDAACQALLAGPETLVAADLDGNGFDDLIVGNRSRNAPGISTP